MTADQATLEHPAAPATLSAVEPPTWERAPRPMRILEVVNDFPPTAGGSETHNTSEVDFLSRRGHSVCVLAARDVAALKRSGLDAATLRQLERERWTWSDEHRVPVIEAVDAGRPSVWSLAQMHRRLAREYGPFDVVVVHRSHFLPAFARARRLVLTLHYLELACPNHINPAYCGLQPDGSCVCYRERSAWANLKWAARRLLSARLVDAVVTKYPHIAERLRAAGIPAAKVRCVPNWVDASAFGGRRRTWAGAPEAFAAWARPASVMFVYLGRLDAFHQPRLALEAFLAMAEHVPGARLIVIGDGAEASALRARVQSAGAEDRVCMLGRVDRASVPAVLSWCDIGLATSAQDNYCWSVLEMMAAGLPVIATAVGGTMHVLQDGVNGYLCAPEARDVAATMRRVAAQMPAAEWVGAAAREWVVARYSPRNLLDYEAILYGP